VQLVVCPICGVGISVAHDFVGKLTCPACKAEITVSRPQRKFPSLIEVKARKPKKKPKREEG